MTRLCVTLACVVMLATASAVTAATPPPSYYTIRQYSEGAFECAVWLLSKTRFAEVCSMIAAPKKAGLKS